MLSKVGEPKSTRSSDISTFEMILKDQKKKIKKRTMGYFKPTLVYLNLTLQLKNPVAGNHEDKSDPQMLPLYHQSHDFIVRAS